MVGFFATLFRWSAAGAGLGAAGGVVLLVVSLVGGRHVWAGMLLIAGVASWPAGVWVFGPLTRAIQAGVWGAELGTLVAGPLVNGGVLGGVLGCLVWFGGHRSRAPSAE